jgi:hypothetical protein
LGDFLSRLLLAKRADCGNDIRNQKTTGEARP